MPGNGAASLKSSLQTLWPKVYTICTFLLFRCQLYTGNYRGLEWSQGERIYKVNPELGIVVEVEVRPDPNQYVHLTIYFDNRRLLQITQS